MTMSFYHDSIYILLLKGPLQGKLFKPRHHTGDFPHCRTFTRYMGFGVDYDSFYDIWQSSQNRL